MRPRQPLKHGSQYAYRSGCRCDTCRAGNADRWRAQRAARATDPTSADRAGHGRVGTYSNYGCRCTPCRAANARASAEKRARAREAS